jgi:TIR domain
MRHHFISYSAVDAKDFALRLTDDLAAGPPVIRVWLDKRELKPGLDWDEQIGDAIKTCEGLLFVMTRDSVTPNSVCKREWTQALKYRKPVIPLRLHRDAELPFRLEPRQYIDFSDGFESGLARLRNHLQWLSGPEGVLQTLKDRWADAKRDFSRAAEEDQPRIRGEIAELEGQIARQQHLIEEPKAPSVRVPESAALGMEWGPKEPGERLETTEYWPLGEGGGNQYWKERTAIVNGAYRWQVTVLNRNVTAQLAANIATASDFEFQADLLLIQGADLVYGFFFRRSDEGGYYLFLSDRAQVGMNLWSAKNQAITPIIPWAFSSAVRTPGSNSFRIRAQSSHITVDLNGSSHWDVIDETFARGQLGLAAQLTGEPSAVIGMSGFRLALLNNSEESILSARVSHAQDGPPEARGHKTTPSWDPAMLERASRELAAYIGPMAKVIVRRAAESARSRQDFYQALAAEIPSFSDRQKFLALHPL